MLIANEPSSDQNGSPKSAPSACYAGRAHHEQQVRGETDDWITPRWIIDLLGPFDLDPCESDFQPWPCAVKGIKKPLGLLVPWEGRVWCNPPYGDQIGDFLERCWQHGNAIAIVFARTETKAFFRTVWGKADGLLFLRGRMRFCRPDGREHQGSRNCAGAPSVLIAYGKENAERLHRLDPEYGRFLSA